MEPHIIYLTDDQGEMLKEFLSLPEDDQRFIRMIIEIGHRNIFSKIVSIVFRKFNFCRSAAVS